MDTPQFTPITDQELLHIEGQLAACVTEYSGNDRGLVQVDLMRILNIQSHLCNTYVPRMVAVIRAQNKELARLRLQVAAFDDAVMAYAGMVCDMTQGDAEFPVEYADEIAEIDATLDALQTIEYAARDIASAIGVLRRQFWSEPEGE